VIRPLQISALVLALSPLALAQDFLMMPDSTNNRLVSFSPVDGSVINSNLFALQGGTPISAVKVGNEIWVSEQIGDRVSRWSTTGTLLGNIGGAVPGGGLDNLRGAAFVNNTYYVTCAGTANGAPGDAVVMYDASGSPLGSFTTAALASGPFSVLSFQGDLLVAGSNNNADIYRFSTTGTPLSIFHNSTAISFAHQVNSYGCCDVICGGFTTNNVVHFDAVGNALSSGTFAASGARGVYYLQSYCTAGTTTNGCVATISADNNPSVSLANTCNISVANVEGQKSGLIFYSITGQNAAPWNATSFLCVKSPTQRTGTQTSGGTVNLCDGTLVLDWNAFQSANPDLARQPLVGR
jgi:hypothetical protein